VKKFLFSTIIFISFGYLFSESITGRVVNVHDGDTVKVLINNKQVKIRLFAIDAPEVSQDFGTKSREELKSLVYKKDVTVETKGIDQYGRTLGVIYLDDKDINLEMLKRGFVCVYKIHRKAGEYMNAEKEAKKSKLGLWIDSDPTPPWEFRKKSK